RADILDVLGKLYFDIGDYARSESLLEQAVATSEAEGLAELQARSLLDLAATVERLGLYPQAREYLQKSLALAQANDATNVALVSDIRKMLGTVALDASGAAAEPIVRETLAYDQAHFGDDSEQVARDWAKVAEVLSYSEKYDEMQVAVGRSLSIAGALHGER